MLHLNLVGGPFGLSEGTIAVAKRTFHQSATVAKNAAGERVAATAGKPRKAAAESQSRETIKPKLLSGGNPQIAKADGDASVQAHIAAMPGWKRDVG